MSTQLVARDELSAIVSLTIDGLTSAHSKIAYAKALDDFLTWHTANGRPALNKAIVNRYRDELMGAGKYSASSINQRMSAIRKLAAEAADNGLLDAVIAQGIQRVHGVKQLGVRAGNWLTREQAQALINAPNIQTLKGLRDRAILAVMIGGGLRRSEVVALTFTHVQQREGRWVIVDLVGKHGRVRSVPIPSWVKAAIDAWAHAASIESGAVFRAMHKGDWVNGERMSAQAIRDLVSHYGRMIGVQIAPHDLRRTYAHLARKGGAALEQIQLSLGHASIQTTEKYLGIKQDLTDAPGDRLGLRL